MNGKRKVDDNIMYLGLGSNLGDRITNLRRALSLLTPDILVEKISPVYETKPQHIVDQPLFLNAVCSASTALPPLEVLKHLKDIEQTMGRQSGPRFGPRPIDIDILFYNDLVLDTPEITIPHPLVHERAFVLVPLKDVAPEFVHPTRGVTISELLNRLPDYSGQVRKTLEIL